MLRSATQGIAPTTLCWGLAIVALLIFQLQWSDGTAPRQAWVRSSEDDVFALSGRLTLRDPAPLREVVDTATRNDSLGAHQDRQFGEQHEVTRQLHEPQDVLRVNQADTELWYRAGRAPGGRLVVGITVSEPVYSNRMPSSEGFEFRLQDPNGVSHPAIASLPMVDLGDGFSSMGMWRGNFKWIVSAELPGRPKFRAAEVYRHGQLIGTIAAPELVR